MNTIIHMIEQLRCWLTIKPVDIKDNTYIDSEKKVNAKDPKLKIGDYVRISKYKKYFC